jgi:putative transposase
VEEERLAAHQKRARRQRAHIVFIDECGLMMLPLLRRTLAPRGQTPIFFSPAGHRHKVSLIAGLTISPRGRHLGLYFSSLIDGSYDAFTVAWFLRELLKHLRGHVIVVWDRGGMHQGPELRQLLEEFPRLSIERLPPYAPDLNPVEHLWNFLKWQQLPNFSPRDIKHLEKEAFERVHAIRYNQKRLLSFFDAADLPFPTRALAS